MRGAGVPARGVSVPVPGVAPGPTPEVAPGVASGVTSVPALGRGRPGVFTSGAFFSPRGRRFDSGMSTSTPASLGGRRPCGRPAPRVFISYRTGDEPFGAALIDTALCARLGPEAVFRAPRSIPLGENFADAILGAVRGSSVLLAVIGPRWLDATGRDGVPRLRDPGDWVRRELLEAFHSGVRVVPVLLHANLPQEQELPPPLARLSSHQYLRLHHRYAPADLARLVEEVEVLLEDGPDQT